MLRVAPQAPHRLILAPGVGEPDQGPAALGGVPGRLTTPFAAAAGPEAGAVAAGAGLALVAEARNRTRLRNLGGARSSTFG